MISKTLEPPYYAVIFTSIRSVGDAKSYWETMDLMMSLVTQQKGYLGMESARNGSGFGVTVSYWSDAEALQKWKEVAEHRVAQKNGQDKWYSAYRVRVCRVEREYGVGDGGIESAEFD